MRVVCCVMLAMCCVLCVGFVVVCVWLFFVARCRLPFVVLLCIDCRVWSCDVCCVLCALCVGCCLLFVAWRFIVFLRGVCGSSLLFVFFDDHCLFIYVLFFFIYFFLGGGDWCWKCVVGWVLVWCVLFVVC